MDLLKGIRNSRVWKMKNLVYKPQDRESQGRKVSTKINKSRKKDRKKEKIG